MNRPSQRLSALLNLLQDDDLRVASLAMEELLKLGDVTNETIAFYQEAQDPRLRGRIHQLGTILLRRRARTAFIRAVREENMDIWEGIVQINALYDLRCSQERIGAEITRLADQLGVFPVSTARLAALMRGEEFVVPEEDTLDISLYLVERVLEGKFGSAVLLCALASRIGELMGYPTTVVLHDGRFCLLDADHLLVDPSEDWHISKLKARDRVHPCGKRHVWLGVLTQMFLVSLGEGHLRDLHHLGAILTELSDLDLARLPWPLGDSGKPVAE